MSKEICYHKNFLTNVIFRLDFIPIDDINTNFPGEFWERIKILFPHTETKDVVTYTTFFKGDERVDHEKRYPLYIFGDSNNEKKVTLSHHYLTLEFFTYEDFSSFKSISERVLASFFESFTPSNCTRLGLRYINQIVLNRGHPLIWKNYIAASLINTIEKFFERDPHLSRAMSQIILNYDEYKLNFNFGLFNSEFPAKISRKEFVLDYDCYTEFFEIEEIDTYLIKFNSVIKDMFEKSIKNGLREMMGVIEDE